MDFTLSSSLYLKARFVQIEGDYSDPETVFRVHVPPVSPPKTSDLTYGSVPLFCLGVTIAFGDYSIQGIH